MEHQSDKVDFNEKSCRVCLTNSDLTNSLNAEISYMGIQVPLWELLENVAKIKCTLNEPKQPKCICEHCTDRLIDAYHFIRQVEKSQQLLQSDKINYDQIEFVVQNEIEVDEQHDFDNICIEINNTAEEQESYYDEDARFNEEYEELEIKDNNILTIDIPTTTHTTEALSVGAITVASPKNPVPLQESKIGTRLTQSDNYSYKCAQCTRVFAKSDSLERHIQRAHTRNSKPTIKEQEQAIENSANIKCKHCPRVFKRQDTIIRHMKAFHPEHVESYEMDIRLETKEKREYKRGECPYCGVYFPKSSLTIHIRRHTGEKPYKCDQCDKGYPRRQDLIIHKRMHTGERPNACAICNKSFISQNKLARHMRLHTGQRPYKCPKCDKSFVQSNDVKIHMRRHTGERPYQCGICFERFICGAQLTTHRKNKLHFEPGKSDFPDPHENSRVNKRRAREMEEYRMKAAINKQQEQMLPKELEEAQMAEIVVENEDLDFD